jgi:hypothetical protein
MCAEPEVLTAIYLYLVKFHATELCNGFYPTPSTCFVQLGLNEAGMNKSSLIDLFRHKAKYFFMKWEW